VATATPTSENALNQELMDAINVKGLQHVIDACKAAGVTRLVYTSSASGQSPRGQLRGRVAAAWRPPTHPPQGRARASWSACPCC